MLVGNPGQVAYVAANSFLDYLAGLRHDMGLPGVSLQLGAWESALIEKLNMKKSFALLMSHKEGVPLVLKAMSANHPVQVVAEFDVPKLMSVQAYAKDPFFDSILPKTSAPQQAAPAPSAHVAAAEPVQPATSNKDTKSAVVEILRSVMELRPSETLGEFAFHSAFVELCLTKVVPYRCRFLSHRLRRRLDHLCPAPWTGPQGGWCGPSEHVPGGNLYHRRHHRVCCERWF